MKKVLLALGAGAVIFFGFKLRTPEKTEYDVKYAIECKDCNISYKDENGETIRKEHVNSSWTYGFTGTMGQFVYISAQNNADGAVKVKVIVDGETLVENTSTEKHVLAAAGTAL